MYVKRSKCSFAEEKVEYLGHVISGHGVITDPHKIEAMKAWPRRKTLNELRGFQGLIGYYRCFIKGYAIISKALPNLLKKNSFGWGPEAEETFESLKAAMTHAPTLALPDFPRSLFWKQTHVTRV